MIVSPRKSTVVAGDGRVRSVQSAELTLTPAELERIWGPANLENLARTYWLFLSRVTLGLIRVVYSEDTRSVVLLVPAADAVALRAPEYTIEPEHGRCAGGSATGCSSPARAGLGISGPGRPARGARRPRARQLRIEVEVANFYPSIAVGFSVPVYEMTQSAIHVLVTNAFLRSLAKLELAESKVGRAGRSARRGTPPDRCGADRSAVADAHRAHLGAVVARRDPPHGARARAHDQRLGAGAAVALVAHALEHVAVGDPGGGEEGVVAGHQVVAGEDLVEVVAGVDRGGRARRRRGATAGPAAGRRCT